MSEELQNEGDAKELTPELIKDHVKVVLDQHMRDAWFKKKPLADIVSACLKELFSLDEKI